LKKITLFLIVFISLSLLVVSSSDVYAVKSHGTENQKYGAATKSMVCGDKLCSEIEEKKSAKAFSFGGTIAVSVPISTDKQVYDLGATVNYSGKIPDVTTRMQIQVDLIDNRNSIAQTNNQNTNSDGTFSGSFSLQTGGRWNDNLQIMVTSANYDTGSASFCVNDPSRGVICPVSESANTSSSESSFTTEQQVYDLGATVFYSGTISDSSIHQVEVSVIDNTGNPTNIGSISVKPDGTFSDSYKLSTGGRWNDSLQLQADLGNGSVLSATFCVNDPNRSVTCTFQTTPTQTDPAPALQPTGMTVTTDKTSYNLKDIITINVKIPGGVSKNDFSLVIFDPNGVVIFDANKLGDNPPHELKLSGLSQGDSTIQIQTNSVWGLSGEYKIVAKTSTQNTESKFSFTGSGRETPTSMVKSSVISTDKKSYDLSDYTITLTGMFSGCADKCTGTLILINPNGKVLMSQDSLQFERQTIRPTDANNYERIKETVLRPFDIPIPEDWVTGDYTINVNATKTKYIYPDSFSTSSSFFFKFSDRDEDGLNDRHDNCIDIPNPDQLNTDGDLMGNVCDDDDDNDGWKDVEEPDYGTDPLKKDTDGDGLPDRFEFLSLGYDPLKLDTDGNGILDGNEDWDGDGLTNIQEFLYKTNLKISDTDRDGLSDSDEVNKFKTSPRYSDSDDDGLSDGDEIITHKTDPLKSDTDGGGTKDGSEVSIDLTNPLIASDDLDVDPDGDGLNNRAEKYYGTDPNKADTDGDGLNDKWDLDPLNPDADGDGLLDGVEVNTYKTNPRRSDSDSDGLSDPDEINIHKTNPIKRDTDGDRFSDGQEVAERTDPLVFTKGPCDAANFAYDYLAFIQKNCPLTDLDFSGKTLENLDLSGKDLRHSNFEGVSMIFVNLSNSKLGWTNFKGASLASVDFRSADLSYADFTDAKMSRANLQGTLFGKTILKNTIVWTCKSPFDPPTAPSNTNYSIDIRNPYSEPNIGDTAARMSISVRGLASTTSTLDESGRTVYTGNPIGTVKIASCVMPPKVISFSNNGLLSHAKEGHMSTTFPGKDQFIGSMRDRNQQYSGLLGGQIFVEYAYSQGGQTYTLTDQITVHKTPPPTDTFANKYGGDLTMSTCPILVTMDNGFPIPIKSTRCDWNPARMNDYFMLKLYDDKENESEFKMLLADMLGVVMDAAMGVATGGYYTTGTMILGMANNGVSVTSVTSAVGCDLCSAGVDAAAFATSTDVPHTPGIVDTGHSSLGSLISASIKDDIKGKQSVIAWVYSENYMVKHPVILFEKSDGDFFTRGIKVSDITDIPGDRIFVLYYNSDKWIMSVMNVG